MLSKTENNSPFSKISAGYSGRGLTSDLPPSVLVSNLLLGFLKLTVKKADVSAEKCVLN